MFLRMTELLGRRLVEEIQRFWAGHAAFPDLQVQGKHGFRERPQRGIVVKIGGANPVTTSADHYRGMVVSRARLTYFPDRPGAFVEWVREDPSAIPPGGPFPSPPGLYWLNLVWDKKRNGPSVMVDALLDVIQEQLTPVSPTVLAASRPFLPRSMRVRVHPWNYVLEESEFAADPAAGRITLAEPLPGKGRALADYRYDAGERGPFSVAGNRPLTTAVPGVIAAVGRDLRMGDMVGIVVEPKRQPTALEYGGQWELSADIDVFARDVHDQREIADRTALYLWGIARSRLSAEGIEVSQVSIGADSEESYDDNAQEPYFTSSIALQCTTEWSVHVPLDLPVRDVQVIATTGPVPKGPPPGTDDELIR